MRYTSMWHGSVSELKSRDTLPCVSELNAFVAHFRTKAAIVNECVIIDIKLAVAEQLRSDVLARLRRSHPGQEAMMSAYEYIWWPFLDRQIIETCENC